MYTDIHTYVLYFVIFCCVTAHGLTKFRGVCGQLPQAMSAATPCVPAHWGACEQSYKKSLSKGPRRGQ